MLTIDSSGHVIDSRVTVKIFPHIERNSMTSINGIVVHQTNAPTAQSTFNSYMQAKANGAHFLIDKDGKIYQTASVNKRTNHVGLLRSRCASVYACTPCKPITPFNAKLESRIEHGKSYPDRFPSNSDSIGIELVGASFSKPLPKNPGNREYYPVTQDQNDSLKWLVQELKLTFGMNGLEVFRHPEISFKTESEASTARW